MKEILNLAVRYSGVPLLAFIFWRYKGWAILSGPAFRDRWVVLAVFMAVVTVKMVLILRWRLILRSLGFSVGFLESGRVYLAGAFLGVVTPGRLGDLIKVRFLTKREVSMEKALMANIMDRGMDVLAVLVISGLALLLFGPGWQATMLAGVALVVMVALVWMFWKLLLRVFGPMLQGLAVRLLGVEPGMLGRLRDELLGLGQSRMLAVLFCTMASWSLYVLWVWVLFRLLGFMIPVWLVLFLMSVSILSVIAVPLSIGGAGVRDAAFLAVLPSLGYTPETALAFSWVMLLMYLITGLIGLPAWIRETHR